MKLGSWEVGKYRNEHFFVRLLVFSFVLSDIVPELNGMDIRFPIFIIEENFKSKSSFVRDFSTKRDGERSFGWFIHSDEMRLYGGYNTIHSLLLRLSLGSSLFPTFYPLSKLAHNRPFIKRVFPAGAVTDRVPIRRKPLVLWILEQRFRDRPAFFSAWQKACVRERDDPSQEGRDANFDERVARAEEVRSPAGAGGGCAGGQKGLEGEER